MAREKVSPARLIVPVGLGLAAVLAFVASRAQATPVGRRPPCGNSGDVDGDGFVTEADANLLLEGILLLVTLSPDQLSRADVDGNGIIDVGDTSLIAQYVAGLTDTFPVCSAPIPTPGVAPWGFSNFSVRVVPWVSPEGATFYFVRYSVIVKNLGSQTATKTVALYLDNVVIQESRLLTLVPEETYLFSSTPSPGGLPSEFIISPGEVRDLQFRTSDGEVSNIITVSV